MKSKLFYLTALLLFSTLLINSAYAQTFLMQPIPEDKPKFGISFMHPSIKSIYKEYTKRSGLYDFYVNIPLGSINFVCSLPLDYYKYTHTSYYNNPLGYYTYTYTSYYNNTERSETETGNLYIGMQTRGGMSSEGGWSLSFGVFLPTVGEETGIGYLSNLLDGWYKVDDDAFTLSGNFTYRINQPSGIIFGLELGPRIFIPTNGGATELFMHYGIAGGFKVRKVAIVSELLGSAIVSESDLKANERFDHFLTVGAQLTDYYIRPGVFFHVPLDKDLRDIVKYVFGLKMEYVLH